MSIDLSKIKSKLKDLQEQNTGNGNGDGILWKPEEGEQIIRIVPYKGDPSNPFIEILTYFNFGGETFVSPLTNGDDDPIYEFCQTLRKQGDEDSYKQSKNFEPTLRTYVPIIVRGKEQEGIKYWGFGKQAYEQLLGYIADPDWGDITHPKTGRDIKITYEVPEGWPQNKSNGFPKTHIMPKPTQTPAMEDLDKFKKMLENQPDIKKVFEAPSYSELEQKLNKYLGKESDSESEDKSASSSSESDTPWADSDDSDDVEKAFDDYFND